MKQNTLKLSALPLVLLCLLGLGACQATPPALTSTATIPPSPTLPPTEIPTPTVTPLPMALLVNDEGITEDEFQAEVARYQAAQAGMGITVTPEQAAEVVREDFIDQLLLAQGAVASGSVLDEASLQARLDTLTAQVGGVQNLQAWQSEHGYNEASFRAALRRQILAAWMRDQITASVPSTGEQVHIWQIMTYNEMDAQNVLDQLNNGTPFADLAAEYDPVTRGELGWFPRGYLLEPVVEDSAFALQPGQYGAIVQSQVGFHILYLVEKDSNRPYSADARLTLQNQALNTWLQQQREISTIILTP